jgi:hypothetical protein
MSNKKILQEIANRLGLYNETLLTVQEDSVTKKGKYELVNNHKRFVKGILKLPKAEQDARIGKLILKINEVESQAAAATKPQEGNE